MLYVTLNNGVKMPQLGYGVYQVSPEECERCVLDALSIGYRSLDTAQAYFNEEQTGNAIKKSGVARDDIFLTTKVWITNYGEGKTYQSVVQSMEKLQTDYLDLMLLHQPFGDTYGAWRDLEKLYREGRIRSIGVSNFYPDRLVDFAVNTDTVPMVNQVEINPYFQQAEAIGWMSKYSVQAEAWAPFGEGRNGLFTDPILKAVGDKYGKSTAQVMLRWNIQRGVVVIPKSTHKERMEENFHVFDFSLSEEDMVEIAKLDKANSLFLSHRDPATVEWLSDWLK